MKHLTVLLILLLLGACSQKAGRATPEGLNGEETFFMQEASVLGVASVKLGQIALQRSSTEEVKQFAQTVIDDYVVAGQQIRNIAEKKEIILHTEPDEEDESTADRLSRMKGSAFDRQYISIVLRDHQKGVDRFKVQAIQGRDSELKAFAERNLPVLQQHLDHAKALHGKLGG
ncbi:MAG: DUF4142 domain-containing protein [Desulfobacteraceae bacterium]|nr:MAG: DUF4142 domain-containing protein [Desulfobacteraceae bacterium]